MYKTVRQGDASLQYTIVPQIDEFYIHDMSSVRGSPTVKGHHCEEEKGEEHHFLLPSTRVFCYIWIVMVIFITITCYTIATNVIDALNDDPCDVTSQTRVSLRNEVSMLKGGPLADDQRDNDTAESTTTSLVESGDPRKLTDDRVRASSRSTTLSPTTLEEEPADLEVTITETTPPSSEGENSTSQSSSTGRTSATTSSSLNVAEESSDSRASIIEAPTNNIVNILRKLKMMKMPRVTLKLRINDTIPQMYMKAGIASYKKGKITTSVLAQGLSLEGLVFKTPEGTIKPWKEILAFDEDSDALREKRNRVFWRDVVSVSVMLVMLGSFVIAWILRGQMIGRLMDMEDAEEEHQNETELTVLDAQIRENEDKECNNIVQ